MGELVPFEPSEGRPLMYIDHESHLPSERAEVVISIRAEVSIAHLEYMFKAAIDLCPADGVMDFSIDGSLTNQPNGSE